MAEAPVLYELKLEMSLYYLNRANVISTSMEENDWELRLVDSLEDKVLLSLNYSFRWRGGLQTIIREFLARRDLRNIKVELIEYDAFFHDKYLLGEIPLGEILEFGQFSLQVCAVGADEQSCPSPGPAPKKVVSKSFTISGSVEVVED